MCQTDRLLLPIFPLDELMFLLCRILTSLFLYCIVMYL